MSTVTIAPHLQRALEAMSKDMAVEPQALVNQAVFAWLRINGYATPGAVAPAIAPVVAAPPVVAPVAVAPVAVAAVAAPTPVAAETEPPPAEEWKVAAPPAVEAPAPRIATPAPIAAAPEPAREPEPEPTPPEPEPEAAPAAVEAPAATPTVDPRVRMSAIDDALARFAKPWPAWSDAEEEDEAPAASDEGGEAPDEDAPGENEGDDADRALDEAHRELSASGEDEAVDTDRHRASAAVEEPTNSAAQSLVDEEPREGHTGETEVEEPHESTVVLKSSPIVLYLERDGQEPVQVTTERFVIGRGPQCDLIIDSPRVSREHAALLRNGVTWTLEDLNSSNGTWFGEERISQKEIESGDVINLGNEPVTFVLRAE